MASRVQLPTAMSYSRVNYEEVEVVGEGMHFLRDPLELETFGITVVDVDAGWQGKPHDHADAGHEEVYLLLEGAGAIEVDGEEVTLSPGDAVRVDPESTRQVRADEDSLFVFAGSS